MAQVHENIQLRFIDSCRLMASSLDQLASNLCGTSVIQCDKCKVNMELINISGDCITSFGCKRCKTKKTKELNEELLKKNFNHTSSFWGCDEKFRLMIRKGVYPYVHMGDREKFEKTSLPPKGAFYSRLNMKGTNDQDYEHAQQVWNTTEKKDPRLLSRYILENRCIVVSRSVRNISEHMLRKLQIGSSTFLQRTRIRMAGLIKDSHRVLRT